MPIAPIVEIIAEIKAGRMVILVDEEDRETEGDLVLAADHVTPEAINFMARFGRGLVCMPITEDRARQLALAPMTPVNRSERWTSKSTRYVAVTRWSLVLYCSVTPRTSSNGEPALAALVWSRRLRLSPLRCPREAEFAP